jgi:hypothetical protein
MPRKSRPVNNSDRDVYMFAMIKDYCSDQPLLPRDVFLREPPDFPSHLLSSCRFVVIIFRQVWWWWRISFTLTSPFSG